MCYFFCICPINPQALQVNVILNYPPELDSKTHIFETKNVE